MGQPGENPSSNNNRTNALLRPPNESRILVVALEDGRPAQRTGLLEGDIIVAFDDKPTARAIHVAPSNHK